MLITKDMNMYGYHDNKPQLTKRLNRIEGQIRGVNRMVQNDTYCIDILTQITAAQAALNKVALELARDHARHCLSDAALSAEDRQGRADELINAMGRLV